MTNETFILAHHLTANGVENLLELKEKDLQGLVKAKGLSLSLKGNPGMRKALWAAEIDLLLMETPLCVSKDRENESIQPCVTGSPPEPDKSLGTF